MMKSVALLILLFAASAGATEFKPVEQEWKDLPALVKEQYQQQCDYISLKDDGSVDTEFLNEMIEFVERHPIVDPTIDMKNELVLLQCYAAAYNEGDMPFLITTYPTGLTKWTALALPHFVQDKLTVNYVVSNISYDEKTGILSSYHKGRGMSDCGSAADYRLESGQMVLVKAWNDDDCDGEEPFEPIDKYQIYPPLKK